MALITCSECGHRISDKAVACPKCGRPSQAVSPLSPDCSTQEPVRLVQPASDVETGRPPSGMLEIRDSLGTVIHRIEGHSLEGITLKNVCLSSAQLGGAGLRGANLQGVDLRKACLQNADLRSVRLKKCQFDDASLAGADLRGARIKGTSFVTTDLTMANLSEVQASDADFGNASLVEADLHDSEFEGTNFSKAVFRQSNLTGARFISCDWNSAELWNTDMSVIKEVLNPRVVDPALFDKTTKWGGPSWLPIALMGEHLLFCFVRSSAIFVFALASLVTFAAILSDMPVAVSDGIRIAWATGAWGSLLQLGMGLAVLAFCSGVAGVLASLVWSTIVLMVGLPVVIVRRFYLQTCPTDDGR